MSPEWTTAGSGCEEDRLGSHCDSFRNLSFVASANLYTKGTLFGTHCLPDTVCALIWRNVTGLLVYCTQVND